MLYVNVSNHENDKNVQNVMHVFTQFGLKCTKLLPLKKPETAGRVN